MLSRVKNVSLISGIILACSGQSALASYTVTTISPANHSAYTTPLLNDAGHAFWAGSDGAGLIPNLLYDGTNLTTVNHGSMPIAITEQSGVFWQGNGDFRYSIGGNATVLSAPGASFPFPEFSLVNQQGQIAWTESTFGSNTVRFWDGLDTHTPFSSNGLMPQINSQGHVLAAVLGSPFLALQFWDGANTTTYSDPNYSSISWIHLDDNDRIFFLAFDATFTTFDLKMLDGNTVHTIASPTTFPGSIKANAAGQVIWSTGTILNTFDRVYDIDYWDGTTVTRLASQVNATGPVNTGGFANSNWGNNIAINDLGHVAWSDFIANPAGNENILNVYLKDDAGARTIFTGSGIDGSYNLLMNEAGFVAWHSYTSNLNQSMIHAWDGTAAYSYPAFVYWNLERTSMQWMNQNGDIAWRYRDPATGLVSVQYAAYTLPNTAPVADAGTPFSTYTGNTVALNGLGSSDADGDALTYLWSIQSAPVGSLAVVSDAALSQPAFTADIDGDYTFSLIVNDGKVDSAEAMVTLTVVTPEAAAQETTDTVATTVATLDTTTLSNNNNGATLNNMFDNVVSSLIADGDYAGTIDFLNTSILPKMDGCALRGTADVPGSGFTKDWVTDCDAQGPLYDDIAELIDILSSQL